MSKSKDLKRQWDDWMRGEWPGYRLAFGADTDLPEDYDDILDLAGRTDLTEEERTIQTAPEEIYSLLKLPKIARLTTKRKWEKVYRAPLNAVGYDAKVLEDGVMKKVELKHRFYELPFFKKRPTEPVFLEEKKYNLMRRAGTDYFLNLFAIDGRPDTVDWAYWEVKDYVRTGNTSTRDEYSAITKGSKSERPKNGYLLSMAIDMGGQFDGREV